MKKLLVTTALVFLTAACAQQDGSTQSGATQGMQCKCCKEMMKEGKECCCKGMMSDKKTGGGKMQCPMCAKMKGGNMSKPDAASKPSPDAHEQHH